MRKHQRPARVPRRKERERVAARCQLRHYVGKRRFAPPLTAAERFAKGRWLLFRPVMLAVLLLSSPAWAGPITSEASKPPLCKPGEVMVAEANGKPKCKFVPRLVIPPVPVEGDVCVVRAGAFHCYTPRRK